MNQESVRTVMSGYSMLVLGMVFLLLAVFSLAWTIRTEALVWLVPFFFFLILAVLTFVGLFIVNPNDSRVLILFGTYKGTVKANGFCWANPFLIKKRVTLRARNLNGDKLKVNDKAGNPIEIAAVVVWQVEDTFKASFEVDAYVTLKEGATRPAASELIQLSRKSVGYKAPETIAFLDEMPLNAAGKVDRTTLKRLAAEEHEAAARPREPATK